MSLVFESKNSFNESIKDVDTLIAFSEVEKDSENEKNRLLFLKLAVVSLVSKFQVYIESTLEEFNYNIQQNEKKYGDIHLNMRLNSLKIFFLSHNFENKLKNHESYTTAKLAEVRGLISSLLKICEDSQQIESEFKINIKYPLGRTGLEELVKLFRQFEGKNIFETPPFDINTFNEILGKRHAIIHEDSNPQLTEVVVSTYKDYLVVVVEYINEYITSLFSN